jgi:phospholipid/cholesterol/gamma-HCH transport system ATP-binding protein
MTAQAQKTKKQLPVIEVHDLTVGYEGKSVLQELNFEVNEGERFVILGGSGCGKSTLLKVLIGLLPPIRGAVHIDGQPIADEVEVLQQKLQQVGVLFQSGALLGSMTVGENIALPLKTFTDLSPEQIDILVNMKLSLVNLGGYESYLPSELSGGMKKRAGLARSLALNPRILFFDEPSAGLDPISSAELDNLILHINRTLGTTIVIVTHELASVFAVGERVIMLDKKTKGIIATGDPAYLRDHHQDPFVHNFFNRKAEEFSI